MEVLNIKFRSNSNNDELEIIEYFVSESVKQRFKNAKSDNILTISENVFSHFVTCF